MCSADWHSPRLKDVYSEEPKMLEIEMELLRLGKLSEIIESTAKSTTDHVLKCHIHADFKSHWGGRLQHCLCSMPENPSGEKISNLTSLGAT